MDQDLLASTRRARRRYRGLWLAEHLVRTVSGRDGGLAARRAAVHRELMAEAARHGDGARPLERRSELAPDEFERRYRRVGRPVVMAGVARSWPAIERWSPAMIGERFGAEAVRLLAVAPGQRPLPGRGRDASLAEVAASAMGGGALYARFSGLLHRHPELVADLDLGWLRERRGLGGARESWGFFMGGVGTATGLHASIAPNLFVQASGRKRWTILSPALAPFLAPTVRCAPYFTSEVDLHAPAPPPWVVALPRWTGELEAGDVLWVPAFAWHQVENLSPTVAVGYRWMSAWEGLRASVLHTLVAATSTNPPPWRARGHRELPELLDRIEY